MSRKIMQMHEAYQEDPMTYTNSGKLIITIYQERERAFLLRNNRLLSMQILDEGSKVGAVYIGKVKNVVKNLNACFVEIADKELCYLPLGETENPLLLNRNFDGRILQGDELVVQVLRDAIKTKQAALTCKITLQNQFFVFAVGSTKVGISAKLTKEIKTEIRTCLEEHAIMNAAGNLRQNTTERLPDYGLVVRTEAGKLFKESPETFLTELLQKEAEFVQLLENAFHRTCFSCLQAPKKPYEAILNSFRSDEYEEVITDLPEAYTCLQRHFPNVRLYEDTSFPLSKLYALETRVQEALSRTVWLKSGANLVIEQTECLTTIDVNSGKMIKGSENEEAVWKINEEAAREAALQIRLRNLSGIIIIDFINMKDKALEEKLLKLMKELTAVDMIPATVIDITPLGLMEITRKKIYKSLQEQLKS